jgi:hypothetical protein
MTMTGDAEIRMLPTPRPVRRERLRETVDEVPSQQPTTRRPCDRCGKPLAVDEPALAIRVPTGGYSIQHQSCGRGRRMRRRRPTTPA